MFLSDRWCAFKKISRRDAKRIAELLQAGRSDAIGAFFVFLNLLERDTGGVGEFSLAQSQQISAGAYLLPDMGIYRSRALPVYFDDFAMVRNPILFIQLMS